MPDPVELGGPAVVVLVGEDRTPLPVDDARFDGDRLVALLDGAWRSWAAGDVHSVKWLERDAGGLRWAFSRGRWPRHLTHDEARALYRRRSTRAALAEDGR